MIVLHQHAGGKKDEEQNIDCGRFSDGYYDNQKYSERI